MAIVIEDGKSVVVEQDKDAHKAYRFELGDLLGADGTLADVTWRGSTGIVVDSTAFDERNVVARFSGGLPGKWFTSTCTWTSSLGESDQFVVRIFIKDDAEALSDLGSALFPNRFTAVAQLRKDNLLLAAQSHFGGAELASSYLWSKLVAAEAEVSRTLRVKLAPTAFFPTPPTQDQIDALNGMPWEEDPAYDYDPDMFHEEVWGFINTNNRPIISVTSLKYAYPAPSEIGYEIPVGWLRMDKKYGQVRIVPSTAASVPITALLMQVMGGNRVIPHMMQLTYVAGLTNAARDFPDLIDVVKKMAVLKIIEDGFAPQSGSISADGLSQSISVDISKYEDVIDTKLNGPKGSNGGLMSAIHGIRLGVM